MKRIAILLVLACLVTKAEILLAGASLPDQELWGARAAADDGSFGQSSGGAEVTFAEALPGNTEATSSSKLTAGIGLPELKIFAFGASSQNAQAEGIQKYRYDGSESGDVVVNGLFSATISGAAQFEGEVAILTEDGLLFNTESEMAQLFTEGQLRANLDETIDAADRNSGQSSSTATLDIGVEANLDPGTIFWVYGYFGGTAFEGEVDGLSTGTFSFADPSNITLLGQGVPEPGSLALASLVALTLLSRRRI